MAERRRDARDHADVAAPVRIAERLGRLDVRIVETVHAVQWEHRVDAFEDLGCIVEEVTGVNNLAEILAFSGIDMIHHGPEDLAHSMGWPDKAQVAAGTDRIVAGAVKAGKFMSTTWGARAGTSEEAEMAGNLAKGFRMFVVQPRAYFRAGGAQFLKYATQIAEKSGIKAKE